MEDRPGTANAQRLVQLERLVGFVAYDPANHRLLTDALNLALDLGHADAARALSEKAAGLASRPPALAATLCLYYLRSNQAQRAFESGMEARAAGLTDPACGYNTAWAAYRTGRFLEARELLAQVCPDPANCPPEANLLFARVLHQLGDLDTALVRLSARPDEFIEDLPTRSDTLGLRALLAADNEQLDAAMHDARQALKLQPGQLDALLAMADVLAGQNDLPAALALYESLTAEHGHVARAWAAMAHIHLTQGSLDQAEACAEKATSLAAGDDTCWMVLGWARLLGGKVSAAAETFRSAATVAPDSADARAALAVIDLIEGRQSDGEAGIRAAEQLDDEALSLQLARSLLAMLDHDPAGSRQLFDAILNPAAPQSKETLRRHAELFFQQVQQSRSPR